MGIWAPSLPGTETVQWGHKRPSFAFLHPSLCPNSLRRSQLSAHTWQYTHTQTHLLLFTGQAGISLHPLACCAHPWRGAHMHTHTVRWTLASIESQSIPSPPRHLTLPPVELFSPHAALCIYIILLLIDHWQPHSYPFCLLCLCISCILATKKSFFSPWYV